jgi:hypothetical protein
MKVAYKKIDNIIELPVKKQNNITKNILQLTITIAALYIANKIGIDIWRSLTGH